MNIQNAIYDLNGHLEVSKDAGLESYGCGWW